MDLEPSSRASFSRLKVARKKSADLSVVYQGSQRKQVQQRLKISLLSCRHPHMLLVCQILNPRVDFPGIASILDAIAVSVAHRTILVAIAISGNSNLLLFSKILVAIAAT
jgi:hypothetical protein